jgi:N-acetylmuramoyl-L-alanine amidase
MAKNYVVLHHSATPDGEVYRDFDSIKKAHLAKGWKDIGYHWVIEKVNGVLIAIPGRPESIEGAHCHGKNFDGIGVCCVGNFEVEIPSEELYAFVANVCRGIMLRHPIKEIGGHRDYYATACPGKNFDMGKLKQYTKGGNNVGEKDSCVINIKGNLFPGYIKGGKAYFGENVPVRDVINANESKITWDEENKVVNVK